MENRVASKDSFDYACGEWILSCHRKTFVLNNHGMKLAARNDEKLSKVIFDTEKKTIQVVVDNPTLSAKAPRCVDLSAAPLFFDELRDNIETILLTGTFSKVTANEDRTIFEVE